MHPIFSKNVVVAITAAVFPFDDHKDHNVKNCIIFCPVACYFPTSPPLNSILQEHFVTDWNCVGCFLPLTSCSNIETEMQTLSEMCKILAMRVIVMQNLLSPNLVEFPQAQISISTCSKVCHPLFPKVFVSIINSPRNQNEFISACPLLKIDISKPSIAVENYNNLAVTTPNFESTNIFIDRCFDKLMKLKLIRFESDMTDYKHIVGGIATGTESEPNIIQDYPELNFSDKLKFIQMSGDAGVVPPPNPFFDKFQVTFLGTGSSRPSKYRSNSCIFISFVQFAGAPSIILDLGEGSLSQLFQSVSGNLDRFDKALLSIRIIWISHHHGDHSAGFPMLMHHLRWAAFRSLSNGGGSHRGKILVIGPDIVLKYYEFLALASGLDDFFTFQSIIKSKYAGLTSDVSVITNNLIKRFRSVEVPHCNQSYGAIIDLFDNTRIVFSGDCRPSQSLINNGSDCDLLIHEATFDDDNELDALKKRHCTVSEALSVARLMRAKHCILTHFSQRYPTLSAMNVDSMDSDINKDLSVAFAQDFMRVSFPSQMIMLRAASFQISTSLSESKIIEKQL